MDIDKVLRTAVESGKVEFGTRSCARAAGKAKMVLVSSNCPADSRKTLEAQCAKAGVPIQAYKGTSMELGAVCGKPFPVSVLAVLDAGTSNILEMGRATAAEAGAEKNVTASAEKAGAESAQEPEAETQVQD
ncbi:MAG: 50S ribosomal protein L30e [Candidatus Burarchaeum sp.]|nr:50S ribosomal protein L30e [Candidatus Burarchaeum sp.]MDO8339504.1 50S ribosomal protein L30e [Candidatus Burarchaeum sp.]